LTFGAGQTAHTITFAVLGNCSPEATETLVINLATSDAQLGESRNRRDSE